MGPCLGGIALPVLFYVEGEQFHGRGDENSVCASVFLQTLGYDVFDPTEEELQGFFIVRSILYPVMEDINWVAYRDTISYFGILFDDNNRKPICRLHFNTSKKYIETFDEEKVGTKYLLNSLNDIYKYSEQLIATVRFYLK